MFWKKKSREDILFEAADSPFKLIINAAQLQTIKLSLVLRLERSRDLITSGRIINYVYYDSMADILARSLCGEKNDMFRAYFRDAALNIVEATAGRQYRTHAADARNYSQIQDKPVDPQNFLHDIDAYPAFKFLLLKKVAALQDEVLVAFTEKTADRQVHLRKITNHLLDLLVDDDLQKTFQAPIVLEYLECNKCGTREIFEDINIRAGAKLYIYKSKDLVTRDGLDIYGCVCFECNSITEYSFDSFNFSGRAPEGIEYFRSFPVDRNTFIDVSKIMRTSGHRNAMLRFVSKNPDKI
jgi:hypothetical protein